MTKEKDLTSDAARSNPDTADQDREMLQKRAEANIERSKRTDTKHDASKKQSRPANTRIESCRAIARGVAKSNLRTHP